MGIYDGQKVLLPTGQISRKALEKIAEQAGRDQSVYDSDCYVGPTGKAFFPSPSTSSSTTTDAVVRVTSTTTTFGLYPAIIEQWNYNSPPGTLPAWSDASATQNAWLFPPNGETYTIQRYPAVFVGNNPTDQNPVFSATLASASPTITQRMAIYYQHGAASIVIGLQPFLLVRAFDNIIATSGPGGIGNPYGVFSLIGAGSRWVKVSGSVFVGGTISLAANFSISVGGYVGTPPAQGDPSTGTTSINLPAGITLAETVTFFGVYDTNYVNLVQLNVTLQNTGETASVFLQRGLLSIEPYAYAP